LCFTANGAVNAWNLFMNCQQWTEVISSISHLFLVTISEHYGPSWCGVLQSKVYFCMTPTWNTDLLKSVGGNFDISFVMKEFPADKRFTIWWINLDNGTLNRKKTET
jgi:hypothetical protein